MKSHQEPKNLPMCAPSMADLQSAVFASRKALPYVLGGVQGAKVASSAKEAEAGSNSPRTFREVILQEPIRCF